MVKLLCGGIEGGMGLVRRVHQKITDKSGKKAQIVDVCCKYDRNLLDGRHFLLFPP
jgi:hypothetical protein